MWTPDRTAVSLVGTPTSLTLLRNCLVKGKQRSVVVTEVTRQNTGYEWYESQLRIELPGWLVLCALLKRQLLSPPPLPAALRRCDRCKQHSIVWTGYIVRCDLKRRPHAATKLCYANRRQFSRNGSVLLYCLQHKRRNWHTDWDLKYCVLAFVKENTHDTTETHLDMFREIRGLPTSAATHRALYIG